MPPVSSLEPGGGWDDFIGFARKKKPPFAALLEHGPLSVDLFSTPAFHKYNGGVFAEHYHPAMGQPAATVKGVRVDPNAAQSMEGGA